MTHSFSIPGLDRQYCSICKRWICTERELERLKRDLSKVSEKQMGKAKLEFNLEVKWVNNCIKG